MTRRWSLRRSRLTATIRNVFLGETSDRRVYERFSKKLGYWDRQVIVKTICEMEVKRAR